jgi:hypothetical protein
MELLFVGVGIAGFWIGAWAIEERSLIKAYRLGPPILIAAMMIWAAICRALGVEESDDLRPQLPLQAAFAVAVPWHLLLIITEKERLSYALYALVHLPILYLLWGLAMAVALGL